MCVLSDPAFLQLLIAFLIVIRRACSTITTATMPTRHSTSRRSSSIRSCWNPTLSVECNTGSTSASSNIFPDAHSHSHVALPTPTTFNSTADGLNAWFVTSVAMATTTVSTYKQITMYYKSWNAVADIGGLGFALWLMHTVCMRCNSF